MDKDKLKIKNEDLLINERRINEIEKQILIQENEFKEIARREGEKGRNQAIGLLSVIATIVGILAGIGIMDSIETATSKAVKEQVGKDLLSKAKSTLIEIQEYEINAENTLDRITTLEEQINTKNWTDSEFLNSWRNYRTNQYNPCGYRKDQLGKIHLRGLVARGEKRVPIFNLPVGYRPNFRHIFSGRTENKNVRIDILINGDVVVFSEYSKWLSLDGINFYSSELITEENQVIEE